MDASREIHSSRCWRSHLTLALQIVPSCLAQRMGLVTAKSTGKVVKLSEAKNKLSSVWTDVININHVLAD